MVPDAFLRMLWPAADHYCLAYPFTPRGASKPLWKNIVVPDIATAVDYIEQQKRSKDLYFAMFTLKQDKVWSDTKLDWKTQRPGAFEIRTHANMGQSLCFFMDIDVGPTKPYQTQEDALAALTAFVKAAQIPWPTLVSSGYGWHVYWTLTEPLHADEWKPIAVQLTQQLTDHHGLKVDPSRTTDVSSVLRVAGTFNRKDPLSPQPVKVVTVGAPSEPEVLKQLVSDAMARAGLTALTVLKKPAPSTSVFGASNLTTQFDGPPPLITEVLGACKQAREMIKTKGDVDQTAWYQGILGTFKWVDNGHHWCHEISKGAASYDQSDTDTKLAQLDGFAPARCSTIASVMPWKDVPCQGCVFANDPSVPNPLVAARRTAKAAAPVVQTLVGGVATSTTIPDPPPPYTRLKDGGIARRGKNGEGEEVVEVILAHDLYPIRRLVDPDNATEHQMWRVHLPRKEVKEFRVEAPALYDSRKFTEVISHQGIYPHKGNVPYLQDYMVAYISKLQQEADADTQTNHLGWAREFTQFVLPDKILLDDGTVKPAALGVGAERASEMVKQAGTLSEQVRLLRFYNDQRYIQHQFFVLGGLAAPVFYMTGQHGVIVNAAGPAGASKSTALYTAASCWGDPEQYPINGTNGGATTRARNERVSVLANLPICVDEITHLPVKDAVDLAMGITQPGHRLRLQQNGVERKASGAYKATVMLSTANNSLHAVLATDNTAGTAGSMRVIEVDFPIPRVHSKAEADEYLRAIKQNYGHIGPEVVAYVLTHRAQVEARVHEVMAEVDRDAAIQSSERFWSAYIAAVLVIGEVAARLGLISFDMAALRHWAITELVPHMRGVVNEEYATPLTILSDYIEMIQGNIIVIKANQSQGMPQPYVHRAPHGALLAHYDVDGGQMFVLKKGFHDFCVKWGASSRGVLQELNTLRPDPTGTPNRIVSVVNTRKTLGAGTDYAKTQSGCFVVNMAHPGVVDGPHPLVKSALGGKADLRLVG